LERFDENG
jgi:hypothetical protein